MTTTTCRRDIHTAANALVDSLPRHSVLALSNFGFSGELPAGVSAADADEFRAAVQDIAICVAFGAVRP